MTETGRLYGINTFWPYRTVKSSSKDFIWFEVEKVVNLITHLNC